MVDPGRSQRTVYLQTWSSWVRQHAPGLLRLLTLVIIFVLFAPVQAAGRQNADLDWSNDAPLGGYQLGDFDGDGKTDLFRIVGTQWQYSSGGTGPWIDLANDSAAQNELRFGDFNGDGKTDVFHVAGIQWRYRPGGVGDWVNLAVDTTTYTDLRFGDFDGDGKTDVFSVAPGGQWRFSSAGSGSYQNLAMDATLTVNDLRFGYFNNDAKIDVFNRAASGQWRYSSAGAGSWTNLAADAAVPYSEMALGDFDGDGITDVFDRQPSGQWRYSKSGTDGWAPLASDPAVAFSDLRFGDFNGDSKTDVFSLGPGAQPRFSSGAVEGWQNITPAASPTPMPPGPAVTDIASLALGDFDGDSYTDVFRSNSGQWQFSARGLGDWQNLAFDPLPLSQLRFGDFNGDGKTDLFSVDGSGQWRWSNGGVSNWQNLAADTLTVDQLRFGDFDGDGKTDVFSVDTSVNPHQWRYRSAGVGAWINLAVDPLELTDLEFGDFDGNGKTDVFSLDPSTQRGRYSPDSNQNWVNLDVQNIPLNLLRFGDFNGDGKTGIFTRADNGQWRYLSAGLLPWIDVAHDPLSINDLRFGDFNADGKTDVFSIDPATLRWRYSSAAVSNWILLGPPGTSTPTPTGSPTPTVTPSPTGSVTPTGPATPVGCHDIIFNGDFEVNDGWIFGDDPVPGQYTGEQKHSGQRSVRLGIPPGINNVQSYSSIRQWVEIPPNTATVTLHWWQWGFSEEGPNDSPNTSQDRFDVIALSPGGDPLRIIQRTRRVDNGFVQISADISELSGYGFYLYFNLYNDGGGGRSWIYLDDMTLVVCPGTAPVATPDNGYSGHYKCTVDATDDSEEYSNQRPNQGGPSQGGQYGGPNQGGPNGNGGGNYGGQYGGSNGGYYNLPPCTPTPTVTATMTATLTPTLTPTLTLTPTATATTTPTLTADLSLTKDVTPLMSSGGIITFTLVVSNAGPDIATGVTVSDLLPSGVSFNGSTGNYSPTTGLWNIGTLTNGVTSTIQISVKISRVEVSEILTNSAQVWTSGLFDPDSTPGNAPATHEDDDDSASFEATEPIGISARSSQQVQPASTPPPTPGGASQCKELVKDGNFEQGTMGWNLLQGPAVPVVSNEQTFNGSAQSIRLGIVGGDNLASISAINQVVALPADANSLVLSFRYYPLYDAAPGPGDLQYVDIYNVMTGQFAGRALGTQSNDRTWLTSDYDLTSQAGQTIRLVLAVNNDGVEGRSAMYVDNVSIMACNFGDLVAPGSAPTPEPSLGSGGRSPNRAPILLAGREQGQNTTWLARLSAIGVLASVAGVIAFAVLVIMGSLRSTQQNIPLRPAQRDISDREI